MQVKLIESIVYIIRFFKIKEEILYYIQHTKSLNLVIYLQIFPFDSIIYYTFLYRNNIEKCSYCVATCNLQHYINILVDTMLTKAL